MGTQIVPCSYTHRTCRYCIKHTHRYRDHTDVYMQIIPAGSIYINTSDPRDIDQTCEYTDRAISLCRLCPHISMQIMPAYQYADCALISVCRLCPHISIQIVPKYQYADHELISLLPKLSQLEQCQQNSS